MPRVKVARKSTAIDMTAMCDVAFLLLTFFILTATARQPEPLPVDTPSSTTKAKQPSTNIAVITIGNGKVFFGVAEEAVRVRTLEKMSERYSYPFTAEEKERFSLMESFGVPIGNLKQVINVGNEQRLKPGFQTGIPIDSIGGQASELHYWILNSRYAAKELNNASLRFSIKGDSKEEYPTVKKIIDMLQKQEVNKFSFITALEGTD
ncbi:ExbD/TolR family protein [Paradesertivirga mongoliensis]|uniref:ExbD/TolR family protein n=1 Tax=Paradesertivirga mongoliensis TaxID=2100740 RepID=A0ABW4ZJB7_9SPHI|nr:biopolymer transporter ExbD [Pedobacter mongoliensis]